MVGNVLRALWAEPRPAHPPVRVWRDWALVAVLVAWSVLETLLRQDLAWRPLVLTVSVVVALTLLWRRVHPLAAVAVGFGTLIAFDVAKIFAIDATWLLSFAALLVLPYALFRWGSGREAAIGLGGDPRLARRHPGRQPDLDRRGGRLLRVRPVLRRARCGDPLPRQRPGPRHRAGQAASSATSWPASCTTRVGHHVSAIVDPGPGRPRRWPPPDPDRAAAALRDDRGGGVADARGDARHGRRPARRGGARLRAATGSRRHRTACPRRRRLAARGRAGVRRLRRTQPRCRGCHLPDRAGVGHQRAAPRPPRDPDRRPRSPTRANGAPDASATTATARPLMPRAGLRPRRHDRTGGPARRHPPSRARPRRRMDGRAVLPKRSAS